MHANYSMFVLQQHFLGAETRRYSRWHDRRVLARILANIDTEFTVNTTSTPPTQDPGNFGDT